MKVEAITATKIAAKTVYADTIYYQPDPGFLNRMELNMMLRAKELDIDKRTLRERLRLLRREA